MRNKKNMSERNFYEILNTHQNASFEELKANYRQLILQCHPDKLQSDDRINSEATTETVSDRTTNDLSNGFATDPNTAADQSREEFMCVNEAWNTLKDPIKRKLYDAELVQAKFREHNNIFERLTLADMTMERVSVANSSDGLKKEHEVIYTYNCRCGGQYVLDESACEDISNRNNSQQHNEYHNRPDDDEDDDEEVIIECNECSLSIILNRINR